MDCAPNMVCLAESYAWAKYCVGKDPTIRYYDENNSNLRIQMDDRRVS